ncbi:malto-oligosyltrehalose trehalohydrolase [Salipiger bermudensis]|uniref:malto-oligosyltrehalose trehalohydrolase n=1 Tax=Salipiger bermudensis TaxID=344736 RepID=UPI001C990802|nr:malto-oligosyltrehalose trehalohydrolase [Salipiger bermudensis]MBY6005070.1 malto-oligosyltrehalose trehalohydrolase [Salipiger bermudensis]
MSDTPRWGAHPIGEGRWRFGLWAPTAEQVSVQLGQQDIPLRSDSRGFWSGQALAQDGMTYRFRVDGAEIPDPASRAQPEGVDGPSRLVDPSRYRWQGSWAGRPLEEAVIFELHVGAFTPEGTFAAAARRLPDLSELGVTAIQLMPLSQFSGQRGWGYDGVLIRAPHAAYGTPDDLRDFVARAQSLGMMVFLDLVMNHFGPFGNLIPSYAPDFFNQRPTPWGDGIAFERPEVAAFFRDAALGWLQDYRLDGFRFDAVHEIRDGQDQRFMRTLAAELRALELGRPIHLICEDERNLPDLREAGFDAEWNDDWHNAMHVAVTGETHGYYSRFAADPFADVAHALSHGQVDEGQPHAEGPRGAPAAHLPWTAFINANQTHDQIGNRALGERLIALIGEEPARVLHAALLLMPFLPMLFMGEEEGSDAPFLFFCDPPDEAGRAAVREGRSAELTRIGYDLSGMPDPTGEAALAVSRPYPSADAARAEGWRALTRELIALRRRKIVPLLKSGKTGLGEVRRHGPKAYAVSWPFAAGEIRMLLSLGAPAAGAASLAAPDVSLNDPTRDPFAIEVEITS